MHPWRSVNFPKAPTTYRTLDSPSIQPDIEFVLFRSDVIGPFLLRILDTRQFLMEVVEHRSFRNCHFLDMVLVDWHGKLGVSSMFLANEVDIPVLRIPFLL